MRIALVQMDVVLGDREGNLTRARRGLEKAGQLGAQMAVLPELWGTGYDTAHWSETAEPMSTGLFAESSAMAADLGMIVSAGSLLERDESRLYNTATVWGPDGSLLASYRKQHLFSLMEEDKHLSAGEGLTSFDLPAEPDLRMGLGICYDLRFPEMFRNLALEGVGLIVIPAQWPNPRSLHWARLLQARAIENLAYVIGVNRVGGGQSTTFCGRSIAIDPWGEILAEAGDEEETVMLVDVDPGRVREARRALPVLTDARRPGPV